MASKEIATRNARYIIKRTGKPMAIYLINKGWTHTETSPKVTQSFYEYPIKHYQSIKLEEVE